MQPADVGWFHSLKTMYKNDWNDWFLNVEVKLVTRFGNICGPGYQKMINWIVKGWNQMSILEISKSFEYCGLSSSNVIKTMLRTQVVAPSTTIETAQADENIFNDIFLTEHAHDTANESEEESEENDDSNLIDNLSENESDISSISSDDGEPFLEEPRRVLSTLTTPNETPGSTPNTTPLSTPPSTPRSTPRSTSRSTSFSSVSSANDASLRLRKNSNLKENTE